MNNTITPQLYALFHTNKLVKQFDERGVIILIAVSSIVVMIIVVTIFLNPYNLVSLLYTVLAKKLKS